MELKKIKKESLYDAIKLAYEGDEDLLNQYKKYGFDFDGMVESTVSMIEETEGKENIEMDYYKVVSENEVIGYSCIMPHFLYSFGIKIGFRKKEILIAWFEKIKELLDNSFICMLYPNDTRPIDFLKNVGWKR